MRHKFILIESGNADEFILGVLSDPTDAAYEEFLTITGAQADTLSDLGVFDLMWDEETP